MNVSKTLTAAVAAASIVGAVGFAYAQTTTDTTPAPMTTQQPSMSPTQAPSDPSSTSATTPAPATSDMASEPMPKADRN